MRKHAYFASRDFDGWPEPEEIKPYFLGPPGQRWFFDTGNDSAGFTAEGVDDTDYQDHADERQIDIYLNLWANPEFGVLLIYEKVGGGFDNVFTSKGDMSRLKEYVLTLHDTPMPIAFYISFEEAWKAVKEFMETDGALPKSIEWVENNTLPRDTFPEP